MSRNLEPQISGMLSETDSLNMEFVRSISERLNTIFAFDAINYRALDAAYANDDRMVTEYRAGCDYKLSDGYIFGIKIERYIKKIDNIKIDAVSNAISFSLIYKGSNWFN